MACMFSAKRVPRDKCHIITILYCIAAPAVTETSFINDPTSRIYTGKDIVLNSIVSGTNIHNFIWRLNGRHLQDKQHFAQDDIEVSGEFSFGQPTARNITLTLKTGNKSPLSCSNATYFNGIYELEITDVISKKKIFHQTKLTLLCKCTFLLTYTNTCSK